MSASSLTTQILDVPSQWWPAAYWPPQVVASYHPEVNWIPHWPFLCPKNIHLFYFWPPSSAQCFGGRKWLKAPLLGNPSTLAGAGRALRCFPEHWGAWELDDFNNTREVESKLKAGGVVPCRTNSIWRVKNVHGGLHLLGPQCLTWKWRQSKTLHCLFCIPIFWSTKVKNLCRRGFVTLLTSQ